MHKIRPLILSVAIAVAVSGCSPVDQLDSEVRELIEDARGTLSLATAPSVEAGSSFLVICPYESKESVDERLGFTWSDAPSYSNTDDRQTIAIVEEDRLTARAELSRDEVDFCSGGRWMLMPASAVLEVTRTQGRVLVNAPS